VTLVSAKDKVTDWPNVKYKTWQIIGGICTERVRIEKEISDRNLSEVSGGKMTLRTQEGRCGIRRGER